MGPHVAGALGAAETLGRWAGRWYSGAGFDNVLYVQFVFLVFCNKYLW